MKKENPEINSKIESLVAKCPTPTTFLFSLIHEQSLESLLLLLLHQARCLMSLEPATTDKVQTLSDPNHSPHSVCNCEIGIGISEASKKVPNFSS